MMPPAVRISLVLLSLVTLAAPAAAQGRGGDAVASEAMLLLRSGRLATNPGETADVQPVLPETFPRDLLPPGAVAELSSVSSSLAVVVVSLDAAQPFERTRFGWTLEAAGWMRQRSSDGVFTPGSVPARYCRGGEFVTYQFHRAAGGGRLVRIAVGPEPLQSCAPTDARSFSDVPIPELALPDGARVAGFTAGGGLDDVLYRARLDTTLSVEALAAWFLPRFEEAGWTVQSGPTTDGLMLVVRLLASSRAGDPVTAQFVLTAFPDTPYVDALARFVRHKPVRVR